MIKQKIELDVSSLETLVQTYFHRAIINSRNANSSFKTFQQVNKKGGVAGDISTAGGVQISPDSPSTFPDLGCCEYNNLVVCDFILVGIELRSL